MLEVGADPSSAAAAAPVLALTPTRRDENGSSCGGGLVYVYDLPTAFNADLLEICDALAPMYSL